MVYNSEFLLLDNDRFIAIKFIESMRLVTDEELVVDKLKDDLSIEVVMTSGKEYLVSINKQLADYVDKTAEKRVIAEAIYDKWRHIISRN